MKFCLSLISTQKFPLGSQPHQLWRHRVTLGIYRGRAKSLWHGSNKNPLLTHSPTGKSPTGDQLDIRALSNLLMCNEIKVPFWSSCSSAATGERYVISKACGDDSLRPGMMEITKMHERLRGNPLFSDPSSCLKPKSVCFDGFFVTWSTFKGSSWRHQLDVITYNNDINTTGSNHSKQQWHFSANMLNLMWVIPSKSQV